MAAAKKKSPSTRVLTKPKTSDLYPQAAEVPELAMMDFGVKVQRRIELKRLMDEAEVELASINSDIEAALIITEHKGVKLGNYVITHCNGRTAAKFSNELAVEKGLDADVVKECWVPGREYTYVQIKEEKEPDA